MSLTIAITGASGFLGRHIADALRRDGHRVVPVTRGHAGTDAIAWDPDRGTIDAAALARADAVIHLAGEPIAQRWTTERKLRIRDSRVHGTELVARTLAGAGRGPRILLSASAVGIYGDRGDERLGEHSAPGSDFLAQVTTAWEGATAAAQDAGVRVVHLRTGLVLDRDGGALPKMLPAFRAGVGGRLGSGRQWMSWIALEDHVRAVQFLLRTDAASGPFNLVAPGPVQNAEFTRALAHAVHRPALFPVPEAALLLMFGEMAHATLLASQRAMPERLASLGFQFRFPSLPEALQAALARR